MAIEHNDSACRVTRPHLDVATSEPQLLCDVSTGVRLMHDALASGASHTTRQRLCGLPSPTGAVSRAIAALDGDWTSVVLYTTGPDKLVVLGTLVDFWPVLCEWDRVVCVLTLSAPTGHGHDL